MLRDIATMMKSYMKGLCGDVLRDVHARAGQFMVPFSWAAQRL